MVIWCTCTAFVATNMNVYIGKDDNGFYVHKYESNTASTILIYFMFFGLLFIIVFLKNWVDFVIYMAASVYYFTSDSEAEGQANLKVGFKYGLRYHLGSFASV